jgi:hypothetical protein
VPVTRAPPRLSIGMATAAALLGLVSVALASVAGAGVAAVGLAVVVVGLVRGRRRWLTAGAVGLFAGVLVAGARGSPPEPLLVGLLGAALAWDVGEHGIGVGEQLGREADTTRVEVVHAAASTAVGTGGVVLGYGVFLVATGGQPVTALVFLLVGVVALVAALRA